MEPERNKKSPSNPSTEQKPARKAVAKSAMEIISEIAEMRPNRNEYKQKKLELKEKELNLKAADQEAQNKLEILRLENENLQLKIALAKLNQSTV